MRQIVRLEKTPTVMWVSNTLPLERHCMAFISSLLINGDKAWAIAENRKIYRYFEKVEPSHINEFNKGLYGG